MSFSLYAFDLNYNYNNSNGTDTNQNDNEQEEERISDKKVAAFYYGWYSNSTDYSQNTPFLVEDDTNWHHWANGTEPPEDATNDYVNSRWTPNQRWFDSADPSVIETHLNQAEWAGIDAFIVSFWGEGFEFDNFKTMLRVASHIDSNLKFTLYLESSRYKELGVSEAITKLTAELGTIYDYFTDENQNPQKDLIWTYNDTPVLFTYVSHFIDDYVWTNSLDTLSDEGKSFFLNADRPNDNATLNQYFQGAHQYDVYYPTYTGIYNDTFSDLKSHCEQFNQTFCAGIAPGYDDTYVRPEANHPPLEREYGDTYNQSWNDAMALDPDWITITSWNEWHEGSEIEPSVENGDLALQQTKTFIEKFKYG